MDTGFVPLVYSKVPGKCPPSILRSSEFPRQAHLAAFQILFILNHFLELRSNPRLGPAARIKWWRQSEGTTSDQLVTGDEPAQWVGMGCRNTSPTSPASLLEKKRQPTRCPFPGRSTPQPAAPGTAKRVCKARLCWVWDLELHCSLSAGPHSLLHQAGPPGEPELHSIAPSPRRPTFCPLTHSRRVSLRPDTRLDVLHISI